MVDKRITLFAIISYLFFYYILSTKYQYSVQTTTEKRNEWKDVVLPFREVDHNYVGSPKYGISFCTIKKSMSTLSNGISCLLYNTQDFLANNRSILENWNSTYCNGGNWYHSMKDVELAVGTTKIAFIRNPIDRFISFYLDKCIIEYRAEYDDVKCFKCNRNMTCFLEKQYERFMNISRRIDVGKITYEDKHSAPLSWNCEFGKYLDDYHLIEISAKLEERQKGIQKVLDVLKEKNVPENLLDHIKSEALGSTTNHATFQSEYYKDVRNQVDTDQVVRDYLRKIYYFDYQLFGFQPFWLKT